LERIGLYVNLDPAAENFDFEPDVDIKDLISLDDAMEEMQLGPNGAMMACFEYSPKPAAITLVVGFAVNPWC
jgi:hypothetical protein